jgi:hypothetical protein
MTHRAQMITSFLCAFVSVVAVLWIATNRAVYSAGEIALATTYCLTDGSLTAL